MAGPKKKQKFLLSSLLAFVLLFSVSSNADVGEQSVAIEGPIIFDAMTFRGEPDLGLSQALNFIYEWEATLRDEGAQLRLTGSKTKPSSRTIEPRSFSRSIELRAQFEYIVIDIESLPPNDDPIAINYVKLAKAAAPKSKIAWWNVGPRNAVKLRHRPFAQKKWQEEFDKRKQLVEANDFCILGAYFNSGDNIEAWRARHVLRIAEARRLYGSKPLFVTVAPHDFFQGNPWPFVSGKLFGEAIDILAEQQVDGIVIWSSEGTGKTQFWDEHRDWVSAVRNRTGSGGRYKRPTLSALREFEIGG
jgi:hypothetical protein